MLGDAIAHAILPGIVLIFLVTHSMHPLWLGLGALVSGSAVTFVIGFLNNKVGIPSGASISLGTSSFFALGILLLSVYAKTVDLDPSCVWNSNLETACFDIWRWHNFEIPRAVVYLGLLLIVNLMCVFCCYRCLFLIAFDAPFAQSIGVSVARWDHLFMLLVTFNIVVCFRIINAPLVVGFLTMPSAIAYLVTKRLPLLLCYTFVVSAILVMNGYWIAKGTGLSLTGMMMVIGGVLFWAFSLMMRPRANKQSRSKKKAAC